MDRREFLKLSAILAATPAVASGCAVPLSTHGFFPDNTEKVIIKNATVISMVKGTGPEKHCNEDRNFFSKSFQMYRKPAYISPATLVFFSHKHF